MLVCFAIAIWQMRYDWTYDETYHYGWVVGPLMAYLFSVRWRDRPAMGTPGSGGKWRWFAWGGIAALLPLIWLIREANPEWRLVGMALAGLAILSSWLWLYEVGGKAWWKHFAWSIAFFAVGIPWPSELEKIVTGALMPANAAISLEALQWLGVPSIRSGNLITMAGGTLGVEEACSGIRSLQGTLMMAIFLGELNFLKLGLRFVLIGAGMLIALITNVLRTMYISTTAAESGLEAAKALHNSAGMLVLLGNSIALFALAHWLAKRSPAPKWGSKAVEWKWDPSPTLTRGSLACLLALVLMGPLVAIWYGRNESKIIPTWQLEEPKAYTGYKRAFIDRRTSIMLRYDDGWSAKWTSAAGNPLHCFYFEWEPGKTPPDNMNVHTPGGCLGAIGIHLVDEKKPMELMMDGHPMLVRLLRFEQQGRPLYLAYLVSTLQRNTERADEGSFDFSYGKRFRAVLAGVRNGGQRLVEIGLWDETSEEQARKVFEEFLTTHVKWKS